MARFLLVDGNGGCVVVDGPFLSAQVAGGLSGTTVAVVELAEGQTPLTWKWTGHFAGDGVRPDVTSIP